MLLNFGAVDYEATVFVNGQQAGFHRGGYFEFTVDITPFVNATTNNELYVDHSSSPRSIPANRGPTAWSMSTTRPTATTM